MHKHSLRFIAIVTLIATSASAMASESGAVALLHPTPSAAMTLAAPIVVSKKMDFNPVEMAKYELLANQSKGLVTLKSAGASDGTKTALIVVAVVVVGVAIAALVWTHGGKGVPVGDMKFN